MISVEAAFAHIAALARPIGTEIVALDAAAGRVLAAPVIAGRTQPPFPASAMDGYAVQGAGAHPGAVFRVIGEAPAGRAWEGRISPGEALRIFTGAVVPEGADRIIIQEDVARDGDRITLRADLDAAGYVRPAGGDFRAGAELIAAPKRLTDRDIALIAAANAPFVQVYRRPRVAILATGDELVLPGEAARADQIVSSNNFGLAAMLRARGAEPSLFPIIPDRPEALDAALDAAQGFDLIVTLGGASVGDHDLVRAAMQARGAEPAFYKIAMRPGKPLSAGRLGNAAYLGLPGNPVSAMVCGLLFAAPLIDGFAGLPVAPPRRESAPLARDLPANGPRAHYMRARLTEAGVDPFADQDSSKLSILAAADCLAIHPAHAQPMKSGEAIDIIRL